MEIKITITAKERFWNGGASIVLDDLLSESFEPLKTCDEPIMTLMGDDVLPESTTVKKVLKLRKNAAGYLAGKLSNCLLKEMQKKDTHNGYRIHNSPCSRPEKAGG